MSASLNLDGEPLGGLLTTELYIEHYALYLPVGHSLTKTSHVSWKTAADLELGLLSSNMQNRRIIDRAFRAAKCQPKTVLETNSVINLWSNVRQMGLATIMPQHIINIMGRDPGLVAVPLVDPVVTHTIGMVTLDREPMAPLVKVLGAAAKNFSKSDRRSSTATNDAISSPNG